MNAHTPGPWKHERTPSLNGSCHPIFGSDDACTMVCECYEGTESEQAANARLIAAAPEMLETLAAVVDSYDDFMPDVGSDEPQPDYIVKARAILARARGEQP